MEVSAAIIVLVCEECGNQVDVETIGVTVGTDHCLLLEGFCAICEQDTCQVQSFKTLGEQANTLDGTPETLH